MAAWFWYAVIAAVLYGAHQIFTRIAADHIGEGSGRFCGRSQRAALSILSYLAFLWLANRWDQKSSLNGIHLFCAYRYLRRRRNNCVLPAVSKRRSAVFRSCYSGGWRRDHGRRWHLVFPRTAILAANRRHCFCCHRFVFAAQIESRLTI